MAIIFKKYAIDPRYIKNVITNGIKDNARTGEMTQKIALFFDIFIEELLTLIPLVKLKRIFILFFFQN